MIKNQFKTVLLLGLLTGVLLGIGSFFGKDGLIIGLVLAVIINFGSYFFSDKIILKIYKAKEVNEKNNSYLYNIVKEVSTLANLPIPKVYIISTESPNAFATGRNPKHAAIACTKGILDLLNKDELKGVIAHEMSHIKNRDILISSIAATVAGIISYSAMMARWGAIFGGFGGDRDNGNFIELLALSIITPIAATLIQLAISRSREYLADESASKILHNPFGLVNALKKLESGVKKNPLRFGNPSTSNIFIINPFSAKGLSHFFLTHPPIEKRIEKLKSMNI